MMTTVEVLTRPALDDSTSTDQSDPYRYGWRYVRQDRDDGTYVTEQIPLTLEDVLHPEEGDQVTHNVAPSASHSLPVQRAESAAGP